MENLSIEEFNPTVAELQSLVETTKLIQVTDINDKDQIELVRKNRITLRDARVNITKKGKELREGALRFQKEVISREKQLIAIIEPEEERLKAIEDEVKQKKVRAERIAVLPQRKEMLASIDDGKDYSDKDELLIGMDDTEFMAYYNARASEKNEADRQANEKRQREIEQEQEKLRIEKETREREEKARQEERDRIEREQKQKKEKEEREKQEAQERLGKRTANRVTALSALGLVFNADRQQYELDDINVHITEITAESDESFAVILEKVSTEINRRQAAAAEKAERERSETYQAFLAEHGYTEENAHEFYIETLDNGKQVNLFKLVGTLNQK